MVAGPGPLVTVPSANRRLQRSCGGVLRHAHDIGHGRRALHGQGAAGSRWIASQIGLQCPGRDGIGVVGVACGAGSRDLDLQRAAARRNRRAVGINHRLGAGRGDQRAGTASAGSSGLGDLHPGGQRIGQCLGERRGGIVGIAECDDELTGSAGLNGRRRKGDLRNGRRDRLGRRQHGNADQQRRQQQPCECARRARFIPARHRTLAWVVPTVDVSCGNTLNGIDRDVGADPTAYLPTRVSAPKAGTMPAVRLTLYAYTSFDC